MAKLLHFQEAGSASGYLLEHLLLESIGATRGGGIFAWATKYGAEALFDDKVFQEFLKTGTFKLFIGTDSITDTAAINKLAELEAANKKFEVRAFLNPKTELFHPKMTWFEHENHLSLIIGSGNLTLGGLRSNWEAFTVLHLAGQEGVNALSSINDFLGKNIEDFARLQDPRVLESVQKNSGDERSIRPRPKIKPNEPELLPATEEVLVAEIPRSKDRWSQANFTRSVFEAFFGAEVGDQQRIILQHVGESGDLEAVETRPGVVVKSANYRFEIAAAKGIPYPVEGRPIGVFLRLSTGIFLYALSLPNDSGHALLDKLLTQRWSGPSREMRRVTCSAADLHAAWPGSMLWKIGIPAL